MMAAGEMDVERRLDRHAGFAPVADLGGVTLGVGGREFAAGVAGAGDQPGADVRCRHRKAERVDAAEASASLSSATPEISRFCQTVRRMSPSPRSPAIFARPRI